MCWLFRDISAAGGDNAETPLSDEAEQADSMSSEHSAATVSNFDSLLSL